MRRHVIQHCLIALTGACFIEANAVAAGSSGGKVRIASDDWCPFVCAADGKIKDGYLVELAHAALKHGGVLDQPVLMPLNRAVSQVAAGTIEAVYAPPIDERLLLSAPLAYSRACFYTANNSNWHYHGIDSLAGIAFGVIDDYGYDNGEIDDYIARNRRYEHRYFEFSYGESAGLDNVEKLLHDRYPAILEHEVVMNHLLEKLQAQGKIRQAGCLEQALPLTIGFAKGSAQSAEHLHALEQGYRELRADGRLAGLQQRYHISAQQVQAPGITLRTAN